MATPSSSALPQRRTLKTGSTLEAGGPAQAPLGWRHRLGYGAGDFGCNLYWQAITLFLYFYYTDVLGIAPAIAGLSVAIASAYDAFADPIMGSIVDRTQSRRGRYRPYMLFGAVPLALSFGAMFYVPPASGTALVIYATLSHILMRTLYTVVNLPYLAMTASMTSDSAERATLAGVRMMFAAGAGISVAMFLPKAVSLLTGKVAQPYFVVAVLIGLLATLTILLCVRNTRENTAGMTRNPAKAHRSVLSRTIRDFVRFWGMLRRNGPLARVLGAIVVAAVALTMFSKCLLYWFKYGLQRPDMTSVALVLSVVMLALFAPFWVWVARRFSKRSAWMAGSAIAATGYLGFWLNTNPDMQVVLGWIALIGVGTASFAINYWAMLPDTVEFNEWKFGERNEATIAGFAAFSHKAALAVNAILLGQILQWAGFVANKPLDASALASIKAAMCLIPVAGVLCSVLLLWKYPITPAFHRRMVDEIARRRQHP
ncbi:sugar glycoside-pentoside-hexuronide (GPH):cation symporter family protein [Cupriavidus basilensis OR16]|uniref:Sugar glycoside-pentoside-hexuronide (GPH):cation symporter family protein n=1 Tax=Cupriavidus basilensis OR16 TaxID=1127483 RepID=H1S7Y7_9BURK|nr:glycoside-pentoside-hexuronide (GPH):cation symporter [Cupriavidus basilensis]EHP41386.1 sugar glycoside-pentoside-hexuronide (GPH):cation symporter family protein [Cupriavidus basilensis OR16]